MALFTKNKNASYSSAICQFSSDFSPIDIIYYLPNTIIKIQHFSTLHVYLALHVYSILTHFPPCTFIRHTRVLPESGLRVLKNRILVRKMQCEWKNLVAILEQISRIIGWSCGAFLLPKCSRSKAPWTLPKCLFRKAENQISFFPI